jgi:nucleoside-diphosphate-sugar epimerase
MKRRLVLTGATGYIGSAFCRAALAQDFELVVLGNAPKGFTANLIKTIPWRLGETPPLSALAAAFAVLHIAHSWADDLDGVVHDNVNYWGTLRLAEQTKLSGCKNFIYISTTSAHAQALNTYGKTKLATEHELLIQQPDITRIARLGLVYGGSSQTGLFGLLTKLATAFPILPIVGGSTQLQPIHISEVTTGLLNIVDIKGSIKNIFVLAQPSPVTFANWLKLLRKTYTGRSLILVPVPVTFALFLCDVTNWLPLIPKISRERVYGLIAARPMSSVEDLRDLGLTLLATDSNLLESPRCCRRFLIGEARAFMKYFGAPKTRNVRVLVRAIEQQAISTPLYLSQCFLIWPFLLRAVEPFPRGANTLVVQRLEMALALISVAQERVRPSTLAVAMQLIFELLVLPLRILRGLLKK